MIVIGWKTSGEKERRKTANEINTPSSRDNEHE